MSPQKYRHIPVEVEAMTLTKENAEELANWCGGKIVEEQNPADPDDVYVGINFPTYDGNKRLSQGEVLVRNKNGHFSKQNAGFFANMFEEVKPAPPLPHAHVTGARRI